MKETWSDYTEGIDAKEQDRDVLAEAKYISDDNEMRIVILALKIRQRLIRE
ncbi:MAG: hypothetical protein IKD69_13320 [Solobacterium sp.]|nr:hypothetical protein [Solobacterium sp.]